MQQLQHKWIIWQNSTEDSNVKSWSDDLRHVGEFNEVSEYTYFAKQIEKIGISKLQSLKVFKSNIKPMWEDPKNLNGGRLVIDIPYIGRDIVEQVWNTTVAFCISNCAQGICGCIYVEKPNVYKISIWIESDYYQEEVQKKWTEALVRYDVSIYFLLHKKSIDSNRNKKYPVKRR